MCNVCTECRISSHIYRRVQRDSTCHGAIGSARPWPNWNQLPRLYTITNAIIISHLLFAVSFRSAAAAVAALVFLSLFVCPYIVCNLCNAICMGICISSSVIFFSFVISLRPIWLCAGLNCFISFASIYSPAAAVVVDFAGAVITMFFFFAFIVVLIVFFHLERFSSLFFFVAICFSICATLWMWWFTHLLM